MSNLFGMEFSLCSHKLSSGNWVILLLFYNRDIFENEDWSGVDRGETVPNNDKMPFAFDMNAVECPLFQGD